MDTTAVLDVAKLLVAGLIGSLSAVLAQHLANRAGDRRHRLELQQRNLEMWVNFLSPIASRRVEAIEDCYDTVQEAIETHRLEMGDYLKVRRTTIYLPEPNRSLVLRSLGELLQAVREGDEMKAQRAVDSLKKTQTRLQDMLGVAAIDKQVGSILLQATGEPQ